MVQKLFFFLMCVFFVFVSKLFHYKDRSVLVCNLLHYKVCLRKSFKKLVEMCLFGGRRRTRERKKRQKRKERERERERFSLSRA